MKKFLKTLVLMLVFVPCAILFSACGKSEEPTDTYDKAANVNAYNTAVESLDGFTLAKPVDDPSLDPGVDPETVNNFRVTATMDANFLDKDTQKNLNTKGTAQISFNGQDLKIIADEQEVYLIGNLAYSTEDGLTYAVQEVAELSTIDPAMSLNMVADFLSEDFTTLPFEDMMNYAFSLDAKAVTTSVEKGVTTVKIEFNYANFFKNALNVLIENRNAPIGVVVDKMIPLFTTEKMVVAGEEKEITVENIIDYIAENLVKEVQLPGEDPTMENKTVGDILTEISGLETAELTEMINTFLDVEIPQTHVSNSNNELGFNYTTTSYVSLRSILEESMGGELVLEDILNLDIIATLEALINEDNEPGDPTITFAEAVEAIKLILYNDDANEGPVMNLQAIIDSATASQDPAMDIDVNEIAYMLQQVNFNKVAVSLMLRYDDKNNFVGLGFGGDINISSGSLTVADMDFTMLLDFDKIGEVEEFAIDNDQVVEFNTTIVTDAVLTADQDLVITGIESEFLKEATIKRYVLDQEEVVVSLVRVEGSTYTLTIDSIVVNDMLAQETAANEIFLPFTIGNDQDLYYIYLNVTAALPEVQE